MLKVGIIVGSTRPGRQAEAVAQWVHGIALKRDDAEYELVDIESYDLPMLDEPAPAITGHYTKDHTRAWSAKIASLDAFVFVTPEYNHSTSAALKNALDFVQREWGDKSAGFVSYGSNSGSRAVEHLRGVMAALQIADVRSQVGLSLFDDFENFSVFKPRDLHLPSVSAMLDEVVGWGGALRALRNARAAGPNPPSRN